MRTQNDAMARTKVLKSSHSNPTKATNAMVGMRGRTKEENHKELQELDTKDFLTYRRYCLVEMWI
jgi:hypothetical protein